MSLTAFIAVALLHLMAAISPGPAVLLSARTGLSEGARVGTGLAAGIALGAVFWASAALFGLSILFEYAPFLLTALKMTGGLFLLYLAVQMWRHAEVPLENDAIPRAPRSLKNAFRLGLLTQLSNPKPAVFFGAVFVGTIPLGTANAILIALLVVIFLNEFLWNVFVTRVFALGSTRKVYMGLKKWIDRGFAGLLAALGTKIALT